LRISLFSVVTAIHVRTLKNGLNRSSTDSNDSRVRWSETACHRFRMSRKR
jgi:hypothetical protein